MKIEIYDDYSVDEIDDSELNEGKISELTITFNNNLNSVPNNFLLIKNSNKEIYSNNCNLSNGKEEPNNNLTKIYKISLIIIIHSNFEKILRLINSINAQSFQFFQIILIYDDNKREKIYDIIKNYSVKYKNIELIDNKFKKGAMFSTQQL
jgi:hypothetical protein